MNLINYILKTTSCTRNLIACSIPTNIGFSLELSDWSKNNKDYILVVPSNMFKYDLIEDGCDFKYIITEVMLTKISNGKVVVDELRSLFDSGKIIMFECKNLKTLRLIDFYINISTSTKSQFEKIHLNNATCTYWLETTGKEVYEFRYNIPEWILSKKRELSLNKILEDE